MGRHKAWDLVGSVPLSEIHAFLKSYPTPKDAGLAVDIARQANYAPNPLLKGKGKEHLAQLDRASQFANFARDMPLPPEIGLPVAGLGAGVYEALKMSPPLMRAISKVPGMEDFAPDQTMSPPSLGNVGAAIKGYASQAAPGLVDYLGKLGR